MPAFQELSTAESRPVGPWGRFVQACLYDYPSAARRVWLGIASTGLAACIWAVWKLAHQPVATLPPVLVCLGLVVLAALFPVKIPRTTHTVVVADVFIFTCLAMLGAPAAVLAAGAEALVAACRVSRRASSRISGPAAAMAAYAVCGAIYNGVTAWMVGWGMPAGPAALAGLCVVAPVQVALTTGSLMKMSAIKRAAPLPLGELAAACSWILAMNLAAAFIAGLVHINALRSGPAVTVVAVGVAFTLVVLVRSSLRRLDAERQAQEALVADAQREAERSRQRFTAAFSHAAIGMAIVQPGGCVLQVNQALCELLGRQASQLVGAPFTDVLHPGDAALFTRQTGASGVGGYGRDDVVSIELRCRSLDGSDLWVALHCSNYEDPGGAGHCLIYQLHDITSRHLAESRLHHIAFHDGLTDLANRTCFHERLEVAVDRSRTDTTQRFAVLFLDLDRFKIVNDSLGHIAGNELLREVAQRLQSCVRPIDLVARLGGDEFAILLEDLSDAEAGMRLAQRVLAALCKPLSINGTEVVPGASIGITFSDLGYRTVDEVLRDADLAMYEAKAGGRGRVVLFDHTMHERVAEKMALEADLRRAIGEGQLSVAFQPMYELEPYRMYGFEALARWVHPQRGPVSPAVFIGLAEESGHIEALTSWVIEHSVAQLALWQRTVPGAARLGVHVNISGRDLARPDLAGFVQDVLLRHGLEPEFLTLEITETTLMGRLDVALQTMGRLRQIGVRFSIDDFGTGYSSLAYLGSLPIDSLKIDRSFVMGLNDKPQNVEIVRAVMNLGQSLGRRVIAEGVETTEQLAILRQLGVPIGQGYLLSRPLSVDKVLELLRVGSPVMA